MPNSQIPTAVAAVVGDVLGGHYYNHTALNTLFLEAGAPGSPPTGNCVQKCTDWLLRCNREHSHPLIVLGGVLKTYMDNEIQDSGLPWEKALYEDRKRIKSIMATHGLSYHSGGRVVSGSTAAPTVSLEKLLKSRDDLASVRAEFDRALGSVEADPPAAITAACSTLEAVFKVFIEDHQLPYPKKQTVKPLWNEVSKYLGFRPADLADQDLKRILTGMASIVDGLGALRTHVGSAHGRGKPLYRVKPRHARLAVNAAHTLAAFVINAWDDKQGVR